MSTFFILLIKLISLIKTADAQAYNLTSGSFVPKKVSILNKTVDQLIGIPYADIPLAFQKSAEINRRSNSTRQADKWSPWCYQPIIFHNSFYGNWRIPHEYDMSLDCLSINLYLPADNEKKNLSVIFYIHGGSNAAGGSSFIDGSALASIGNVLVAVPNYRLDVLGFFNKLSLNSTSNQYLGNYGLWDQVTALKWLYNNCENLGCDKNSIVTLGHSAGAADSLILALSEHAQQYIKRIIMQSGSALSHWSYNYDQYVLQKIKESENDHKSLLFLLDFKSYKSMRSVNDTLVNFVSVTTCNLTHKYTCLKEKMKNVTKLIDSDIIKDKNELIILNYFHKLLIKLDFYQLLNVLGYFQRLLILNKDTLFVKNFYSQSEIIDIPENSSNFSDQLFFNFVNRNNQDLHSESENVQKSTCYMDLALLISNSEIILVMCEIFKNSEPPYDFLFTSKLIRYVLNCFRFYYTKNSVTDFLDHIFIFNVKGTLKELEACVNQGTLIYQNLQSSGQIDNASNFTLNYTQKEYCFLTKNSNYLYKPSTDGELIKTTPHSQLANDQYFNSNIDVLIGVTTTESFYFLLHSYDMNEMIKHAFIHSSMINQTDHLIEKLIIINQKQELNLCLKRNLVDFYQIDMSDQELRNNYLKGKLDALELMSDFDFRLSVISQLKFHLENKNASNQLYVYLYSHVSSFNYLLDHLKSFYDEYRKALVKLNNSVTPHFSELDFVFGLPVLSQEILMPQNSGLEYNYTQQELDFSLGLIKYWTNFAKFGKPKDNEWEAFDSKSFNIFELNDKRNGSLKNLFKKWMEKHQFWYDKLPNEIFDNCLNKLDDKKTGEKNGSVNYLFNWIVVFHSIFVFTVW